MPLWACESLRGCRAHSCVGRAAAAGHTRTEPASAALLDRMEGESRGASGPRLSRIAHSGSPAQRVVAPLFGRDGQRPERAAYR